MKRIVSRPKLKKILKHHVPQMKVTSKAEIALFLDYIIFLRRLAAESSLNAASEKTNVVQPHHVKAAGKRVLKSCRG